MAEKKKKRTLASRIGSLFKRGKDASAEPQPAPASRPEPVPSPQPDGSAGAGVAQTEQSMHESSPPINPTHMPPVTSTSAAVVPPPPPAGSPDEPALPVPLQRKSAGPKPPKLPLPKPVTQDQETRIGLLVRDPRWLFAYWEISPHDQKRFGLDDTFRTPRMMLRVYELSDEQQAATRSEYFFDIGLQRHVRAWYVRPPHAGRGWRAALGILRETGRFEPMCLSNFVQSPPEHAAVDAEGNPWRGPELGMPDLNDPESVAEIFRLSIGEGDEFLGAPFAPAPLSPEAAGMAVHAPSVLAGAVTAGEISSAAPPPPAASRPVQVLSGADGSFKPFAPAGSAPVTSAPASGVPMTVPGLAPSSAEVTGAPPLKVPFMGSSNLPQS